MWGSEREMTRKRKWERMRGTRMLMVALLLAA